MYSLGFWPVGYSLFIGLGLLCARTCYLSPDSGNLGQAVELASEKIKGQAALPQPTRQLNAVGDITICVNGGFLEEVCSLFPIFRHSIEDSDGKQKTVGTVSHDLNIKISPIESKDLICFDAKLRDELETKTTTIQRSIEVGMFGQSSLRSKIGVSIEKEGAGIDVHLAEKSSKVCSKLGVTRVCLHRKALVPGIIKRLVFKKVNRDLSQLEYKLNSEVLLQIRDFCSKKIELPNSDVDFGSDLPDFSVAGFSTGKNDFMVHLDLPTIAKQQDSIVEHRFDVCIAISTQAFFEIWRNDSWVDSPVDKNSIAQSLKALMVIDNEGEFEGIDGLQTDFSKAAIEIRKGSKLVVSLPVKSGANKFGEIEIEFELGIKEDRFAIVLNRIEANGGKSSKLKLKKLEDLIRRQKQNPTLPNYFGLSKWKRFVRDTVASQRPESKMEGGQRAFVRELRRKLFSEKNFLDKYKIAMKVDERSQRIIVGLMREEVK